MNLFNLTASDLMIWGLVLHLIADWPLQNDWMANNKAKRRIRHWGTSEGMQHYDGGWYDRHPAAYVHAGIHGLLLAIVFGWVALPLALVHLVIDTRWPVAKWSQLVKQTQPANQTVVADILPPRSGVDAKTGMPWGYGQEISKVWAYDIGTEVRFWTDQVFHIATIAIAALLVTL